MGNFNVDLLRYNAVEYVEAILSMGEQHPSGMYDVVKNHVISENPTDNEQQAISLYREQQEADGWGSDLTLMALSFRYNVRVRLYDTLTDDAVNGGVARPVPVVHVLGPRTASCEGYVLASQNHFDPLVLGEGTVRLQLTRPVHNAFRTVTNTAPRVSSGERVTQDTDTAFADMTCDQHQQAFFFPRLSRKRKGRHVVMTITLARREHDLNQSIIAAFGLWLQANQSRFTGACASTERGSREGRLHVQCAAHLDMVVTDDSHKHMRAWLRKHLQLPESEGYSVVVNIHPVTRTSRVTWEAQAGYTRKEQGQPHYRVLHQHGETDEWFRNALYEYETTAAAAPFFKRTEVKPRNIARLLMEFERRELWPGNVFLSSAQVLRFMMLSGNYQLSSDFVTFAKGINVAALEAIRSVEYAVFSGHNVDVEAVHMLLQTHNQAGPGLHYNTDICFSDVGRLYQGFMQRQQPYDTRTLPEMRSEIRRNRAQQRGDRIGADEGSPPRSAGAADDAAEDAGDDERRASQSAES